MTTPIHCYYQVKVDTYADAMTDLGTLAAVVLAFGTIDCVPRLRTIECSTVDFLCHR